jgi:hypothetical protein
MVRKYKNLLIQVISEAVVTLRIAKAKKKSKEIVIGTDCLTKGKNHLAIRKGICVSIE